MTIKRNYGNANFGPLLVEENALSYSQFLDKVTTDDAKLHANTLMPYEIITPFFP